MKVDRLLLWALLHASCDMTAAVTFTYISVAVVLVGSQGKGTKTDCMYFRISITHTLRGGHLPES